MDNRSNARHSVAVDARLEVGQTTVGCRLVNLSLGGAFVVGASLPIDTQVTLYLTLPMIDGVLAAPCSVRWATDDGCGLQFDGLRAIDVWALGKYIGGSAGRAETPRRNSAPS